MAVLVALLVYIARWWTPLAVVFLLHGLAIAVTQIALVRDIVGGRVAFPHRGPRGSSLDETQLRDWFRAPSRRRRAFRWALAGIELLARHVMWPVSSAVASGGARYERANLREPSLRVVAIATLLLPARDCPATRLVAIAFALAVTAELVGVAIGTVSILERWAQTRRQARWHVIGETLLRFVAVVLVFVAWRVADGEALTLDLVLGTGRTLYTMHSLRAADLSTLRGVVETLAGLGFYFAFLRQVKRVLWWKAPPHVELARIASLVRAGEYDDAEAALEHVRVRDTSWAVTRAVVHLARNEPAAARRRIATAMDLEGAAAEDPTLRLLVAARSYELPTKTILAGVIEWAREAPNSATLSAFLQAESGTNREFAAELPAHLEALSGLSRATALLVTGDLPGLLAALADQTFDEPFARIHSCYLEGAARTRLGSPIALTIDLGGACAAVPAHLMDLAWMDLQMIRQLWRVTPAFEAAVTTLERRMSPSELVAQRERLAVAQAKVNAQR